MLHIAKPSVLGTFSNGEHAVKEIVEPFASCKVLLDVMGQSKERLGVMWEDKDRERISLFRNCSAESLVVLRHRALSMAQHR